MIVLPGQAAEYEAMGTATSLLARHDIHLAHE
jgi:hypothetical protein